jgi:hypothetical protein
MYSGMVFPFGFLLNLLIRSCGINFDGSGFSGIDDCVFCLIIIIPVNATLIDAVKAFGD